MNELMIKHHLNDDLLIGYAAGTLPEAFNLVVATHISMCDTCRAALGECEAIGGSVLDQTETAEIDDDAFAKTMAMISDLTDVAEPKASAPRSDVPAPLHDYIGGGLDSVKWRSVGMGVKQAILKTSPTASVRLLHIPAGAAVPDHGHNGTELTLVIKGAFADEVDEFGPGDVEIADETVDHMPVADISADCICLAATDAPLKFNSWIPKLAQPFLKI